MGAADDRSHDGSSIDAEIVGPGLLDASALRRRWRTLMGRPMPKGLGRSLALRILAYQQQAQQFGDLDKGSQRELAALVGAKRASPASSDVADGDTPASSDASARKGGKQSRPSFSPVARPGTLLVREHAGVLHRVMVLDEGFAWTGKTYDSLSKVAFAITGTRWNGPRFFGLRDKPIEGRKQGKDHRTSRDGDRKGRAHPVAGRHLSTNGVAR